MATEGNDYSYAAANNDNNILKQVRNLQIELFNLKTLTRQLTDRVQRSRNLVISGLVTADVNGTDNYINAVNEMCDRIGVDRPLIIDNIFRLGKTPCPNKQTKLLVKFVRQIDKKNIIENSRKLRQEGIYISDDLSVEERNKCWLLRSYFRIMQKTRPEITFCIRKCVLMIWSNNENIEQYHVVDGKIQKKPIY